MTKGSLEQKDQCDGLKNEHQKVHGLQWSQRLWREASKRIAGTAMCCLFGYVGLASLFAYMDGVRGVDIPYYISACVTTVGIGDIVPESQLHRAATVLVLPFGLVIISMCLSAVEAYAKAVENHGDPDDNHVGDEENAANICRRLKLQKKMQRWHEKRKGRPAKMRRRLAKVISGNMSIVQYGA